MIRSWRMRRKKIILVGEKGMSRKKRTGVGV